jgi:hypothetical protein
MWYEVNIQKYRLQEHGTSIMTVHQLTDCSLIPEFLTKHLIPALPQLTFSPDASLESFLFITLKMTMKQRFQMAENIIIKTDKLIAFQEHSSNSASRSGKGDGRSAFMLKKIILKGISVTKLRQQAAVARSV